MTRLPPAKLVATMVLLLGCIAGAQAEPVISLPLDGYYRPGKFFPVQVTSDQPVKISIDVDNGVGATAYMSSTILPVMLLSNTSRSLRVVVDGKSTDLPIRPLEESQRLAVTDRSDLVARAGSLFSGKLLLTAVMPHRQIGSLGIAFESADVILADEADEWAATNRAMTTFTLGGPPLAVPIAPGAPPWKSFERRGGWNVLNLHSRGPTDSLANPAAYDAMAGVVADRPMAVRRTVWLGMAMFAILALAAALLVRRATWLIVLLVTGWMIGAGLYVQRQSPITEQTASIRVWPAGEMPGQKDRWLVQASLTGQHVGLLFGRNPTRPIFASNADAAGMRIFVGPLNSQYEYELPRGGKRAFVTRSWFLPTAIGSMIDTPSTDSLGPGLAQQFYLRQGESIRRAADEPDGWVVRAGP